MSEYTKEDGMSDEQGTCAYCLSPVEDCIWKGNHSKPAVPVKEGTAACKLRTDGGTNCAATPCQCRPSPEMERLVALLKKSKQLASIGYRIGEADMRGHDKIGERYGKQQDELIAEIDTFLDHIEGNAK